MEKMTMKHVSIRLLATLLITAPCCSWAEGSSEAVDYFTDNGRTFDPPVSILKTKHCADIPARGCLGVVVQNSTIYLPCQVFPGFADIALSKVYPLPSAF